jgi:hypothetical protein
MNILKQKVQQPNVARTFVQSLLKRRVLTPGRGATLFGLHEYHEESL